MHKSISKVIQAVPIWWVFAVTADLAAEECTISESRMLEEVKRAARAYPGATIRSELLSASWVIDEGIVEFFSVRGCHDYKKVVQRVTDSSRKRDSDAVIRVALELGQKYMPVDVFEVVAKAVQGDIVELDESGGVEYCVIDHRLGEIVITHSFSEGVDTVTISWPFY